MATPELKSPTKSISARSWKRNTEGLKKGRRWQKGQSGNPGGRPKELKHLQELCRENTETAITALIEVASDDKANPGARVAAACALLDRGYGRPTQQIKVDQDINLGLAHLEALKALNEMALEAKPEQEVLEARVIEEQEEGAAIIDLMADDTPRDQKERSKPSS